MRSRGWYAELVDPVTNYRVTFFTVAYSENGITPPTNPTAATETHGAGNNAWQNSIPDPAFTWSGASDGAQRVAVRDGNRTGTTGLSWLLTDHGR